MGSWLHAAEGADSEAIAAVFNRDFEEASATDSLSFKLKDLADGDDASDAADFRCTIVATGPQLVETDFEDSAAAITS